MPTRTMIAFIRSTNKYSIDDIPDSLTISTYVLQFLGVVLQGQ